MAVTVTPTRSIILDKIKLTWATLLFDATYAVGGEPLTAADFGFIDHVEEVIPLGGQQGFNIEWTGANLQVVAPAWHEDFLNPEEAARDLAAVAADVSTFHVTRDLYVTGFLSVVTTLLACETIQPIMSVDKRDADGTSNAVELATITYGATDAVGVLDSYTLPDGAVGGGASVNLATPYLIPAGYTIVLVHKTQGTGAVAAGQAKCHITVADVNKNLDLDTAFDLSGLTAVRVLALGW